MTLTNEDFESTQTRYLWACSACRRIFATNMLPQPPIDEYVDFVPTRQGATRPDSADETREWALRCCPHARNMPATYNRHWTRDTTTGRAVQIIYRDSVRLNVARETVPFTYLIDLVPLGLPQVVNADSLISTPLEMFDIRRVPSDVTVSITRYKIDVAFDDVPERQRDLWLAFIAYGTIAPQAGAHEQAPLSLVTLRERCVDCSKQLDDEFGVRHAFAHYTRDDLRLLVPARMAFALRFAYARHPEQRDAPPLPIAFLRVTLEGSRMRDVM